MTDIIDRIQIILNGAEERELDGTETRVLKDSKYEIESLRKKVVRIKQQWFDAQQDYMTRFKSFESQLNEQIDTNLKLQELLVLKKDDEVPEGLKEVFETLKEDNDCIKTAGINLAEALNFFRADAQKTGKQLEDELLDLYKERGKN